MDTLNIRPELDLDLYRWEQTVITIPPTPNLQVQFCRGSPHELNNPIYEKCYDNVPVTNENGIWFYSIAVMPSPVPCQLTINGNSIEYLGRGGHWGEKGYFFEYHIDTGEWKQVSPPTLNILVKGEGVTAPIPDRYWAIPREEITVTATPMEGNRFSHFESSIDGDITVNPYRFTMDSDRVITAVFISDTTPPPPTPPTGGFNPKKLIFPLTVIVIGALIAD